MAGSALPKETGPAHLLPPWKSFAAQLQQHERVCKLLAAHAALSPV